MQIANPIYDVVFKYLLEDKKVAKLLLSAILDKDVVDIEFLPQEYTTNIEEKSISISSSFNLQTPKLLPTLFIFQNSLKRVSSCEKELRL